MEKERDRKKMVFAGAWYPVDQSECKSFIDKALSEDRALEAKDGSLGGDFFGGIVPHAGWYYSGSIACRVIASLKSEELIDTVVLFGGHMHAQSSPFILSHGFVETPFGDIEVDQELTQKLAQDMPIQKKSPAAFPDENTFELQNPFVKYFFPDSKIVVCAVSPNDSALAIGKAVAQKAHVLGKKIRVIGSTDMTHYGPNFGFIPEGKGLDAVQWVERKNDRHAIDAMIKMDGSKIISKGLADKSMCCPGAAAATVEACKVIGAARAFELDYATSFEKSASDSFVGYSGVLFAR